jgi:hypothetical protein
MLRNGKLRHLSLIAVLALVLLAMGAVHLSADPESASYQWVLGGPFFTNALGLPNIPDTSVASNGDTVALEGQGTLTTHPKSVTGGGTFTFYDADGNVLAAGTWEATQLMSFVSYGHTGPGTPAGLPEAWEGGQAVMRIHLSTGEDATLIVNCTLGNPPAGKAGGENEGIKLAVQGGPNFTQQVGEEENGGFTVFIRQ